MDENGDRPRFLGRTLGYTPFAGSSIDPGAEAVSEEEQLAQTSRARRHWLAEQARAWGQAHRQISGALEAFVRDGHPDRRLLADVQAIARQVGRVDKRLDREVGL